MRRGIPTGWDKLPRLKFSAPFFFKLIYLLLMVALYKNKYRVESARLRDWDYSIPWWYYITICTKDMKQWLGEVVERKMILNDIGKIIDEEWKRTEKVRQNVELDYYQIMPNHLHGIIIINGPDVVETHGHASLRISKNNLSHIIRGFKGSCTMRIRTASLKSFSWQSRFYDHIIRNDKDLYRIRKYIYKNPIEWELDEYY